MKATHKYPHRVCTPYTPSHAHARIALLPHDLTTLLSGQRHLTIQPSNYNVTHLNIIDRQEAVTRQLETQIGKLTHDLLSISDPTKSAQIAADIIATIQVLVYVRGGDLS